MTFRSSDSPPPAPFFVCGRRGDHFFGEIDKTGITPTDTWRPPRNRGAGLGDDLRSCSYCGSMHPDDVFVVIEAGGKFDGTDKNYKAYVGSGKFYFQHFSVPEQLRFIELVNAGKVKGLYVTPFFMTRSK